MAYGSQHSHGSITTTHTETCFRTPVDSHAWQGPNPQKFTYWSHLGAMLLGQWSARKSLLDLVFSVNRQVSKYCHRGLAVVKRVHPKVWSIMAGLHPLCRRAARSREQPSNY